MNPIDHPICLGFPELLAPSHWAEHVPFAVWIVSMPRPRLFVELGTYHGTSYCGLCQAIKRLGLGFLASVAPETYMYTLSILMAAQLFPVCLDLEAQAERIRESGHGLVLQLESSPAEINDAMIRIAGSLAECRLPFPPERSAESANLLDSYYGFTEEEPRRFGLPARPTPAPPRPHFERRITHACVH
jgi:hypothetical protein